MLAAMASFISRLDALLSTSSDAGGVLVLPESATANSRSPELGLTVFPKLLVQAARTSGGQFLEAIRAALCSAVSKRRMSIGRRLRACCVSRRSVRGTACSSLAASTVCVLLTCIMFCTSDLKVGSSVLIE